MDLLLKRNEIAGALGARYDLFAKLELEPDELARMRKAQPDKYLTFPYDDFSLYPCDFPVHTL